MLMLIVPEIAGPDLL